jgi:hypothetical protein
MRMRWRIQTIMKIKFLKRRGVFEDRRVCGGEGGDIKTELTEIGHEDMG